MDQGLHNLMYTMANTHTWTIDNATWFQPNQNDGWCECGCGDRAPIADKTDRQANQLKGHSTRYIRYHKAWSSKPRKDEDLSWYRPNTTNGFCECGCGEKTLLADATNRKLGYIAGEPKRFILGHQAKVVSERVRRQSAETRYRTSDGYIEKRVYGHPYANATGRVREHRLVVEEYLGYYLAPEYTVHHKNGVRDDNRIENLEVHLGNHGPGATHCEQCGECLTPPVLGDNLSTLVSKNETFSWRRLRIHWNLENAYWFVPNEMGGLCHCGCGMRTNVSNRTDRRLGLLKGQSQLYHRGHAPIPDDWYKPNTNNGYCMCGCGELTSLAPFTNRRHGVKKGEPHRFRKGHQSAMYAKEWRESWEGVKYLRNDGYVMIACPDHPDAKAGKVLEHRLVVEKALGHPLSKGQTVHHKNGIRYDNRIENLQLRDGDHGPGATHCWNCDSQIVETQRDN